MRLLSQFRHFFLPSYSGIKTEAEQWSRIFVLSDVLENTAHFLYSYGSEKTPHEGIVYWAGVMNETASVITTVLAPEATTTPGSYRTGAIANAMVVVKANELHLNILAQVHGHPGSWVGHSEGDNQGAFMPYPGFYSVVAPLYGTQGLTPLTKCGIHRYQEHHFVRLANHEVQQLFFIVPTSIDLRGNSTTWK